MAVIQQGSVNLSSQSRPDLWVQIVKPSTQLINGVPTNIIGMVGIAEWGVVNSPVTIASMSDYNWFFGDILPEKYDLGSAVYNAVLNGANNIRCVRITDGTDDFAEAAILDDATTPATGMTVTARYTGEVGNSLQVDIQEGTKSTTTVPTYKVIISRPGYVSEIYDNIGGTGVEVWQNMVNAINLGQTNYRSKSQLVVATIGTSTATPDLTSYTLDGGSNGNTGIDSSMFIGTDGSARTGMYALRNTQCSITMLCDLDDSDTWIDQMAYGLSEGTYMIITGESGQYNAIDDLIALKKDNGIDNYDVKLMLGDWCYFNDTTNDLTRLISPQSFIAGRLSNLSPEKTGLNKEIVGIVATEATYNNKVYSGADLDKLTAAGIDVITNPIPRGDIFGARIGHNTSSNDLTNNDSYTRMTNYLAYTLNASMGSFIGENQSQQANDATRNAVRSTVMAFLNELKTNKMIDDYLVVCDLTNNTPDTISKGYLYCDVTVQYLSIVEKFIINLNGSTLTISRQAVN